MNNGLDFRSLRKRRHLCETLELDGDNRLDLLLVPQAGKDVSKVLLRQLADTDPDALHFVVWHQAGFHLRFGEEGAPDKVRLLLLPGYSLERIPVMPLSDTVKDGIANRLFTVLSDVEAVILNESEPLRTGAHRARHPVDQYSTVSSANVCGRK